MPIPMVLFGLQQKCGRCKGDPHFEMISEFDEFFGVSIGLSTGIRHQIHGEFVTHPYHDVLLDLTGADFKNRLIR